ncbi:7-deoxyloganetin glucosyltransferase-like protein [Tanacetum coccineum]
MINTWDLLKKAFIQRYCPPSKTEKQLEEIYNFKQKGDETLYQACERYNDLLYKFPPHYLNRYQKVNIFYKGLDTMARQLLDLQGPIPNKTPAQALVAIQTMADHSQKRHDGSTSKKVSNSSSDRTAATANKLDKCPLREEVKSIEEVKYGEFGRSFLNNNGNGARYRVGINTKKRINGRLDEEASGEHVYEHDQKSSLKNLETQTEQLAKDCQGKAANEVPNSSIGHCKAIFADDDAPSDETSSNETNELHEVSFISDDNVQVSKKKDERPLEVLPCQLPLKELTLGSFTLPCTIGSLNMYALAHLGASVNIMPRSMFNHLKLTNLKKTYMLVEMADMTKSAPIGIVENILVKIDKFLFPSDFMIIDMLGDPNETMILGRPFLATIHARIDVFNKEISLGVGEDRIIFDMNGNVHHPTVFNKKVCMVHEV